MSMNALPPDPFETSLLPVERTLNGKPLAAYTEGAKSLIDTVNRNVGGNRLWVWGFLWVLAHDRRYISKLIRDESALTEAVLAWADSHDGPNDYDEANEIVGAIITEAKDRVTPAQTGAKKNEPDPLPGT